MRPVWPGWRTFFLVAALYDLVLGAVFVVFGEPILEAIGMALPPHVAYIQLAAVFIFVQGLSYWLVCRDPLANLGLVRVGVAYKVAYAGLALYYLVIGSCPSVFFIPWAVVDLLFLVGFVMFLRAGPARRAGVIHAALHRRIPVELTADRRITRRVKRLAAVSAVALGLIWVLAVATLEAPTAGRRCPGGRLDPDAGDARGEPVATRRSATGSWCRRRWSASALRGHIDRMAAGRSRRGGRLAADDGRGRSSAG